jgi:two-component system, NtrC family, response regulator
MAKVLIIDDDGSVCQSLAAKIKAQGHAVATAKNLKEGISKAEEDSFDVVFLDVYLPDGNGLDKLPEIRTNASQPEVIIITGAGDPDGAELAIKNGAWDYLEKPFAPTDVVLQLTRALQYREEKINSGPYLSLKREGVIGSSPSMNASFDLIAQVAQSDVSVLLTGETGTGKEVFANLIHQNSRRAEKSFVVVDCAVLPANLIESTLFGHVRGAFTGANISQDGLVKQADKGTLFLDEVGDLPLPLQKKFLRVLQEQRFRPVGGKREMKVDYRLIAATNRDLDQMVKDGKFRSDLLFRLRTFNIQLPPLRERQGDIPELAVHYVRKICERNNIPIKGFSPEFFQVLNAHKWPGNVRELVNTLERAVAAALQSHILFPKHLPDTIRTKILQASIGKDKQPKVNSVIKFDEPGDLPTLKQFRDSNMEKLEKKYLENLIVFAKGDTKRACEHSGLGRARLYQLLKKYNVKK